MKGKPQGERGQSQGKEGLPPRALKNTCRYLGECEETGDSTDRSRTILTHFRKDAIPHGQLAYEAPSFIIHQGSAG